MKIVLVQRVLPTYRQAVFEAVRSEAQRLGHDFELWYSQASPAFARRGTEGTLPWARCFAVVPILRLFEWQRLPWREMMAADLLILPDNLRVVSHLAALLLRRISGKAVVTWGHGANFQPDTIAKMAAVLRYQLLRLTDGYLVYTDACIAPLIAQKFKRTQISVIGNAIDSTDAIGLHERHPEVADFRARLGLDAMPCVAFLGSWYARKRPELIANFGRLLREKVPSAQIIVIGGGDGVEQLKALKQPWIKVLGPLHGRDKFVALSACRCLAISGVAGLNVLDAMACGLPVVAPVRSDHSPEIAFVQDGINGRIVPDDPAGLADACARLCTDEVMFAQMSNAARLKANTLSVHHMASALVQGALKLGQRHAP